MSRIGRKPVIIPANVTVDIAEGNNVTVKGPKGTLNYTFHPDMILKVEGNELIVDRPDEEHLHKSLHGLTRTLLANMVEGVSNGRQRRRLPLREEGQSAGHASGLLSRSVR